MKQAMAAGERCGHPTGTPRAVPASTKVCGRSRKDCGFAGSLVCAATLLADIGDCRARYPHRDAIAAQAGHAPVAVESGKRKNASFRWACNKRLRSALVTLADTSGRTNPWAKDRYANARARGHTHPPRSAPSAAPGVGS